MRDKSSAKHRGYRWSFEQLKFDKYLKLKRYTGRSKQLKNPADSFLFLFI